MISHVSKKQIKERATVILPPLILLAVGVGTFWLVQKVTTPEVPVISSKEQPAATSPGTSRPLTMIVTEVTPPTPTEIAIMQSEANAGSNLWRLDPLQAAKILSAEYGFVDQDAFTMTGAKGSQPKEQAVVTATHQGKNYTITMIQPKVTGPDGVWIIKSIALQDEK